MFNQTITNTPLVSQTANNYFRNITGDSFRNDVSFLSTLRAVLSSRVKQGESVRLMFTDSSYSESRLAEKSASSWVKTVSLDFDSVEDGTIVIHNFRHSDQSANYAWIELMKSTFTSVYEDWVMLEKITVFFQKSFYTLCFVNPARKCTVVFVDNLNLRKLHYLQCATFALLPYFFNAEDGVSELEMELAYSFKEKSSAKFNEVMAKFAEQLDFRSMHIRNLLRGFESQYEKQERDKTVRDIKNNRDTINNYNDKIGELLKFGKDLEIKLAGLIAKINEGGENSEIMEYFLRNKRLTLESVNGTSMTFTVKDYLCFYDENFAERVISNRNSIVYCPDEDISDSEISEDDMEMLMRAVFVDEKIKMKTCAAYEFDMNGNVRARSGYSFDSTYNDCMPNVHVNSYACMGDYPKYINQLLADRDYIGAIEQCVASCRSLNFGDSTVLNTFMEELYGVSRRHNTKCFELPTGEVVDQYKAIEWLKEENNG